MSSGKEAKVAKQSGKRKASKDNSEAPVKQHKTESKTVSCPECQQGRLNCPPDEADSRTFCEHCRGKWSKFICVNCEICSDSRVSEQGLCHGCAKDEEEEKAKQEKPKCKVCDQPVGDNGVCWELHSLCSGKCGKPVSVCHCVRLSTDEEAMLRAFQLDARLNNIKYGTVEMGPDWEFMLEHAKKVVKMAETNLEAQRKLRAV